MIRYTLRARREVDQLADQYPASYLIAIREQIDRADKVHNAAQHVRDRPDVRRVRHASHFVYLRHDANGDTVVLRITHTRRDREHL